MADGVALAPRVSTQGLGLDLIVQASERVNFRAGAYGFGFSRNETASDVEYDLKANLFSAGGYVDWYAFGGNFHLTAGALYNANKLKGTNTPDQEFKIGGHTYTSEEIGSLEGRIDFNKFSPYAGFGWGNAVGSSKRVKFLVDVGAMFHGTPKASLMTNTPADSPLNDDPERMAQLQDDIEAEVEDFRKDIADIKVYPVVSFGVSIAF